MATHPKYDLKTTTNDQFHFNLTAKNGQVILSSEVYTTKQAAENGIDSVRAKSPSDNNFERKTAANGQFMFNLKAANHQVIGTSEMYTSTAARDNGIDSVIENGPTAELEDNT